MILRAYSCSHTPTGPWQDYYDQSGDEGGAGSDDAAVRRGLAFLTKAMGISYREWLCV